MTNLIKLADGTLFDPIAKKKVASKNEPSDIQVSLGSSRKAIRIEDLPAPPKQMNVIAAVIAYQIIGMTNNEIAYALGCTPQQLDAVISTDAYISTQTMMLENYAERQRDTAKGLIAAKSIDAAKQLANTLNSEDEALALRAAESILDRSGVSNESTSGKNGLVIRVVKDVNTSSVEVKLGG